MTYPDAVLHNQWPGNELQNSTTLNTRIDQQLNTLVPRVTDGGWITPTLLNSWVSFDGGATFGIPQYRLKSGVVQVAGLAKSGTINPIFTLPAGFRPNKEIMFLVMAGGGTARIDITPAGSLFLSAYAYSGNNSYLSLNGIEFIPDA